MMIDMQASLYQDVRNTTVTLYQTLELPMKPNDWGTSVCTGIPSPLFNGIVSVRDGDKAVLAVGEVDRMYKEQGVPYCWWFEKSYSTPQLEQAFVDQGLELAGIFPGMGRGLDAPIPKPVHNVEEVGCLDEWAHVVASAFEFTEEAEEGFRQVLTNAVDAPYIHMAVKEEGKIVSTGSVLFNKGCAYISNIATLEEFRNQGYAQSVITQLLRKAQACQMERSALISSPMAASVYKRMGFHTFMGFLIYLPRFTRSSS